MPNLEISAKSLKTIQTPDNGQVFYWDTSLLGFGIKALPGGLFFVVQRRLKKESGGPGKSIRKTLGRYPEVKLEQAKVEAMSVLAGIGKGTDPRQKAVKVHTLQETYQEFLASRTLRPTTLKLYSGAMRRCFEDWQDLPITEISKAMVEQRHKLISNRHGARGKGEAHGDQAMRFLRGLFNYANDSFHYFESRPNPVRRLSWNGDKKRESRILETDLKAWYTGVGKLKSQMIADYLLLCLFTGLRRTEAAKLRWSDIDYKNRVLTIPKEHAKNKTEHRLPLSDAVMTLLAQRKAVVKSARLQRLGNDFVFPGEGKHGHLVESKASVAKVAELSGVKFMVHDLRRTFASVALKVKIDKVTIAKLLNHKSGDVTLRYLVTDIEDLRISMNLVSDYLTKNLGLSADDGIHAATVVTEPSDFTDETAESPEWSFNVEAM